MAAGRPRPSAGSRDDGTIIAAMPVLRSRLDPDAAGDARQPRRDGGPRRRPPARQDDRRRTRRRRRRPLDRAPSRARQAAGPRTDRPAPRPGLRLPRAEPARRHRPLRRRGARAPGIVTGHRPDRGHDLRRRRQRRDRQGRHLLPDDRQEAPPRPGDRPREPAAVRLPRRLRRRVPAAPGRRLPGPRPLRADLLQPGPDVGRRHPAGRAGDGLVHGRRRVRPGDERRDRHRQGHGHDLPRRSAAGEGRDRRGRHARGAGRLRGPHPALRRRRPRGARRRARAGPRPIDRREPQPQGARRRRGIAATPEPPAVDPARHSTAPVSLDARRPVPVREIIARLVDGSRASTSSSRSTARRS